MVLRRRRQSNGSGGGAAETPLLNTTTGVSGITIDAKQIAQLPLGDGTAYMLTRLAPGIMDSSDLHFARPMDNGNLGGIVANGVQGGNEFTIDGAPNLSNAQGRRLLAAVRRDRAVQGPDQRLRRADRPHGRRRREPGAEERHQLRSAARPATSTATPSRTATPLLDRARGRHQADARPTTG